MDITLINPPQVFSKYQVAAGVTPPLGIAYLAAISRDNGYKVSVIDALGESPYTVSEWEGGMYLRGLLFDQIVSKVRQSSDIVGISNLFTFAYPAVAELCKRLKDTYDVPIVLGGAHPSATPNETLNSPWVDFVVISEGEQTLLELCECLESSHSKFEDIDGLGYKIKGQAHLNPKTRFLEDLDKLPFPARDMLPLENYFDVQEAHGPTKGRWTPIISSRGCPFECTFCTSKLWNQKWRGRSAKNVVDELEYCIDKYDIREFHFEDENMTLKKKRTIEICNEIIDRGLDIKWQTPNGIRASVTDHETLLKMKESGCYHITVAPESGSVRVLKEIIRKHQDLDQVRSVIKYASEIKLKTAAYFILGLPGETKEDIKRTISVAQAFAKDGLDEVAFSLFIPIPGSELYEKLFDKSRMSSSYEDLVVIGDLTRTVSWSEHITNEELMNYRREAYVKFYLARLMYHPMNSFKSLLNILRGIEETKTERTIRTFIRRTFGRKYRSEKIING